MAYTPDATDVSQPTSDVKASTAAAEFRAIKEYIRTLVVGAINAGPGTRQTALIGSQDANGGPNFLSAGTGLALNLAATAAPLCLTYAGGSDANGDVNFSEQISADVAGVVSALPPSNLSYITKLLSGAWGSTLAPCQYGKVFDKTAQFLCRWPGANNAVATTEDFGNALTFAGNAKLSTAVQILGANTLACDGTGDYVTTPFTSVGAGSWEFTFAFRHAAIGVAQRVFSLTNAGAFGIQLRVQATGLWELFLSSNGTGWDIANVATSANVGVINTNYLGRLVFDLLAGTYRLYISINGAAEVQEINVASTALVCGTTTLAIGATVAGAESFNGNIGYFSFRRFAANVAAVAVPPAVAPTFADVRSDWFSIPQMKMYQVTAASTVAGTNPELTAVNKLYLGEATTNGAAVSSVVNYAFKGNYDMPPVAIPANGTQVVATHNIGVPSTYIRSEMGFLCATTDSGKGSTVGDYTRIDPIDNGVSAGSGVFTGRLSTILNGVYSSVSPGSKTSGARAGFTVANWRVAGNFKRTF